jgi:serine protease Do
MRFRFPALLAVLLALPAAAGAAPEPGSVGPIVAFSGQVGTLVEAASPCLVRVVRASDEEGAHRRMVGSGICVGEGFILTAASVVGPGRAIEVLLPDAVTVPARLVGLDRRTNLALLQVDAPRLPALELSPEADIGPGELVVAVGFGPDSTTVGSFGTVVLTKGPNFGLAGSQMIQVTAPPFPGLTGGVLLNRNGQLVGLVSGWMTLDVEKVVVPPGTPLIAGYLRHGTLASTQVRAATVAIPASQAASIAGEIRENGYVRRGYLGLQLELSRNESARRSRLRGVMVHGVVEDGPAQGGGLLPGDVILEYAGARIQSPEDLSYLVGATLPGSSVPVQFLRRGHHFRTTVTVEQAPEIEWVPETDSLISAAMPGNGVAPSPR